MNTATESFESTNISAKYAIIDADMKANPIKKKFSMDFPILSPTVTKDNPLSEQKNGKDDTRHMAAIPFNSISAALILLAYEVTDIRNIIDAGYKLSKILILFIILLPHCTLSYNLSKFSFKNSTAVS